MSFAPLVNVESEGLVAVSSAAWRYRGNVRATVVVKAELSFEDGIVKQVEPSPIRRDTEMAFVLSQAEVLFGGLVAKADAPGRVAVWRGNQQLMGLETSGAGPGIGGHLSPFDPQRTDYLGGFSAAAINQRFVELPDTFDNAFFQCAPPAQRLANLAGGDTVVLEHLYPGHRRFVLRLPTVDISGHGRLDERTAPIGFTFDTVFIDAERHRCALLWRGRVAASTPDALARTAAVAKLKVTDLGHVEGDHPPPWPKAAVVAAVPPPPRAAAKPPAFAATINLGATAVREASGAAPTPFGPAPGSQPPATPRGAIPGAPWAGPQAEQAAVPSPEGIQETVGLEELQNQGAQSGGVKLPKGLGRRKGAKMREAAASADDQAQAEAEAKQLELQRRQEELAAAEERRKQEAERFAAEQRAAQQAEAERAKQEADARKQANKKLKTAMYGKFNKK